MFLVQENVLYNILIVLLYPMGGKYRTRASASILVLYSSSDTYSSIMTCHIVL